MAAKMSNLPLKIHYDTYSFVLLVCSTEKNIFRHQNKVTQKSCFGYQTTISQTSFDIFLIWRCVDGDAEELSQSFREMLFHDSVVSI